MNRGSATGALRGAAPGYRFNEAPIHESGKFYVQTRLADMLHGFNEAPIHESGKFRRAMRNQVERDRLQ